MGIVRENWLEGFDEEMSGSFRKLPLISSSPQEKDRRNDNQPDHEDRKHGSAHEL